MKMVKCVHVEGGELALEKSDRGFRCSLCGAEFIDPTGDDHVRPETLYEKSLVALFGHLFQGGEAKIGDTITIKRPARYL